jgi:hypothetical protein
MESNLLACNSNWLDSNANNMDIQLTTIGQNMNIVDSYIPYNIPIQTYYQPYYYPVYYTSPARPIKLTLSELEKLRKVAKNDKSIKDILMKFTALIEITVDF